MPAANPNEPSPAAQTPASPPAALNSAPARANEPPSQEDGVLQSPASDVDSHSSQDGSSPSEGPVTTADEHFARRADQVAVAVAVAAGAPEGPATTRKDDAVEDDDDDWFVDKGGPTPPTGTVKSNIRPTGVKTQVAQEPKKPS
ncbi:hypothetical protein DICSQDRAFT_123314 [Dichomitus squalens LYAD-421 SS1]|uniref:uncharacterized protein n=1 Tax=Dichomitus squalens (strain LYAD-421) TaxID=732165 RepID=UPI0004414B5F|nr:uncharacterized protein DICSQDRAFT_123314 [Dichomitus squalens LYAD-421 SS1]EJF66728.1 hypothetical protein DICSQDRAFT_123314 [Dichomitus squalens LYAD-421 SS1]